MSKQHKQPVLDGERVYYEHLASEGENHIRQFHETVIDRFYEVWEVIRNIKLRGEINGFTITLIARIGR